MQVHPLYDINDQVWVAETGVVARTLRELQQKLPKAKIVGYYPDGYVADRSGCSSELRKIWYPVRQTPTAILANKIDKEVAKKAAQKQRRSIQEQEYYARQKAEFELIQQDVTTQQIRGIKQVHVRLDREAILNLRALGERTAVIARKLNYRFNSVSSCLTEAKHAGDPRAATPVKVRLPRLLISWVQWTLEQDQEFRGLVAAGYKDLEIAAKLGRTKNSIIGRRHRLGLKSN